MKKYICTIASIMLSIIMLNAETTLYRSFVNGNTSTNSNEQTRDLHIEYILSHEPTGGTVGINVLTPIESTASTSSSGDTVKCDIQFSRPLAPGQTISTAAHTSKNNIELVKWWWTNGNHNKVRRIVRIDSTGRGRRTRYDTTWKDEYTSVERGDETSEQLRHLPAPNNNPYNIYNKGHHWGGRGRFNEKIRIKIDIRKLIKNRPSNMDAQDLEDNLKMAIRQLANCTILDSSRSVPKAGQNNNPENHGQGLDPGFMAAGPTHRGGRGAKFRSVTARECEALFFKYPRGLEFIVISEESDTSKGDVDVKWGGTSAYGENAIGVGPSEPVSNEPDRTGSGSVLLKKSTPWHLAEDTDGDGYITNKDTDQVPNNKYDFYSVFKHELGHVLCFNHSCSAPMFVDEFPEFLPNLLIPFTYGFSGEISSFHTSIGDNEEIIPETIYFSALSEEGFGGYDIWAVDFIEGERIIYNLGPTVNTQFDEVDPFITSDGTQLFYSSNRSGGFGAYDLYRSLLYLAEWQWMPPENLGENINTAFDERNPSLRGDIMSLYFSSDREGGLGGFDIWHSEIIPETSYSPASNFYTVNSEYNEISPFISPAGTCIYFSSDRPGGFGGYDLWRAANISGWRTPKCLPDIINTEYNEKNPTLRSDHSSLILYSDKVTSSDNILYFFDLKEPDMPDFRDVNYGGTTIIPFNLEKMIQQVSFQNNSTSIISGFYLGIISHGDITTNPHFTGFEDFQLPNMTLLNWTSTPLVNYHSPQAFFKINASNEDNLLYRNIYPFNSIVLNLYFSKNSFPQENDAIIISPFNSEGYQILRDYPEGHFSSVTHQLFNGFTNIESEGLRACYNGFNGTEKKISSVRFFTESADIKVIECKSSLANYFDSDNQILYFDNYIEEGEPFDYCFTLNKLENYDVANEKIFTNIIVEIDTLVNYIDDDNVIDKEIISLNSKPNPAYSQLDIEVELSHHDKIKLTLEDLFGNEIFVIADAYTLKRNTYTISVNTISTGIYILKLKYHNKIKINKIIILK